MGFLKDFFSENPWEKVDPERKFRNKVMDIIGTWEFSKLDGLMQMYKALEQDFFRLGTFSECPDDLKMDTFVVFISNFAISLAKNNKLQDAEIIFRISIKLKSELPAAYLSLIDILIQTGRIKEAAGEAKAALKAIDSYETKIKNLDISIPEEYQLGDMTEVRSKLYELIKTGEEV